MKIKFLITGVFLVSATGVFAQKGVLSDANDAYTKYLALKSGPPKLSQPNLDEAKTLIDKAAANEKTANLPLTFAVKGGVYSSLALNDSIPSTSTPLFVTADEALKKAKELDTKGENKKLIDDSYRNLGVYRYTKGVKEYRSGNFNAAYESFNYYHITSPDDTIGIYYSGLAAINAKKYPEAITSYTNLLTTKYSNKPTIYNDLTSIYLMNRDTANALKTVSEGVDKYPSNASLTNKEIQLYLQTGKIKEVSDKLEKGIANDPKNKSLYYYSGYISLQAKDYDKAIGEFNKALEIDPGYYDANLSMGFAYLNPGIDVFNKANKLPTNKANQKQYDDMSAKAAALFDKAIPYLQKAADADPKSTDALSSLRNAYLGKKDNVNANLIQKKIDALKN